VDNFKVLEEIISHFYYTALRRDSINIRGVIFLHDISETRMSSSQKKTWEILRAFCGPSCMSSVIVGTTMWSDEGSKKFKNEEERERHFQKECGLKRADTCDWPMTTETPQAKL